MSPRKSPDPGGYTIWDYPTGRGKAFVTELRGLSHAADEALLHGRRIARKPVLTVMASTRGRHTDRLGIHSNYLLLVAASLREVLEDTPRAKLQFLPVKVPGADAKYALVNVLDTHPGIDLARSRFDVIPGTDVPGRIHSYASRPAGADAPPIFHIAEAPHLFLVSDELRRRLEAASKTAGQFTSPDRYGSDHE
jgi:hypothetical protein